MWNRYSSTRSARRVKQLYSIDIYTPSKFFDVKYYYNILIGIVFRLKGMVIVLNLTLVIKLESFCLSVSHQGVDYHWQYIYVTSQMYSLIGVSFKPPMSSLEMSISWWMQSESCLNYPQDENKTWGPIVWQVNLPYQWVPLPGCSCHLVHGKMTQ